MDKKEIDRIVSIQDSEELGKELEKLTSEEIDEVWDEHIRRGEKNPDYSIWESLPESKPLSEFKPGESMVFFIRRRATT